jgi:hypothetical protein
MLDMIPAQTRVIIIENDEDVELVGDDLHVYVQVKTRNRQIQFSDIDSSLDRFADLRNEHEQGRRAGAAKFVLVTNNEPGLELLNRLAAPNWPGDVSFVSPHTSINAKDLTIPRPWPDLGSALAACEARAALIPFTTLAPNTLVLKLAGRAQYLATGDNGHTINQQEVTTFFEQLVVQLQEFPQPPSDYRPQPDEPDFQNTNRIRLIIGASGAGKTVWASHAALTHPSPTMYFDIADLPGPAVAFSLARELVARCLSGDAASLPQASGLELLGWASARIDNLVQDTIVVLDNVHHVQANVLQQLVSKAARTRFVLLGQEWPGQVEVEAILDIRAESLGGWSLDDIAAVFAEAGCQLDAATGRRILEMTAGMPLYVRNAAQITADNYSRNAASFVESVSQRLNAVDTVQEAILSQTFDLLSHEACATAALLEIADIPLERSEALEFLAVRGDAASSARSLRELARFGIIEFSYGDSLKLHDAFRLLARDARSNLEDGILESARVTLVELLEHSQESGWTLGRFALFMRLLTQTDRIGDLITLATTEEFHQIGDPSELRAALEAACDDIDLDAEDRFWALDALAFWEYQRGTGNIEIFIEQMAALAEQSNLGALELAELTMKKMIAAGMKQDRAAVEAVYAEGVDRLAHDPGRLRILKYNYALAMYNAENYVKSWANANRLLAEYFNEMNLTRNSVFRVKAEDVRSAVPDTPQRDDNLRRAGDCLDLMGKSLIQMKQPAGMDYLHAMKLYSAARAWRSAVRAGQDAADEVVAIQHFDDARKILEEFLLPVVTEYQLTDLLIPVRAQYAVILARCGDIDAARNEISKLQSYRTSEDGAVELALQRDLIESIAQQNGL